MGLEQTGKRGKRCHCAGSKAGVAGCREEREKGESEDSEAG